MTDDERELVAQLQHMAGCMAYALRRDTLAHAADRIEALAAENARLREQLERVADRGTLVEVCRALGWQGGTLWLVLDEVRRLKALGEGKGDD